MYNWCTKLPILLFFCKIFSINTWKYFTADSLYLASLSNVQFYTWASSRRPRRLHFLGHEVDLISCLYINRLLSSVLLNWSSQQNFMRNCLIEVLSISIEFRGKKAIFSGIAIIIWFWSLGVLEWSVNQFKSKYNKKYFIKSKQN